MLNHPTFGEVQKSVLVVREKRPHLPADGELPHPGQVVLRPIRDEREVGRVPFCLDV